MEATKLPYLLIFLDCQHFRETATSRVTLYSCRMNSNPRFLLLSPYHTFCIISLFGWKNQAKEKSGLQFSPVYRFSKQSLTRTPGIVLGSTLNFSKGNTLRPTFCFNSTCLVCFSINFIYFFYSFFFFPLIFFFTLQYCIGFAIH